MPAFPVYLGIDVGTQSVKTVLYSMNATGGRVVHATGFSNPIPINNLENGYIEQNPSDWIVALHESVAKTFEGRWNMVSLLAAIGVSGQQHGLVTVGSDDEIVRPCMLWCDTRAEKEAAELTDVSSCDAPIPAGFTGPKLLWLKRHEPENFHKTVKVMLPHDYINYYLSGCTVHVMERGDASGTGLLHSSGLYFDRELLEYIDATLHLKFPKTKLKSPNEMIGKVASSVASTLFQSDHYQYIQTGKVIYLSPGSGDNAMSALGVGASVPGSSLVVSLGTSGTLFTCHSRRLTDASGVVAPFCDATGNWLPLTCIQNCGLVCEEIRVSISDSCAGVLSVNEITEVACREPIGCEGVVVIPYFSSGGERTPNWPHASGGMLGLRSGHLNRPGLLYRAALESICFALYRGYLKMQAIGLHSSFKELQVVGGGAENELWCQVPSLFSYCRTYYMA